MDWLQHAARQPFVQFTLLGALVFAGHRLVMPASASDVPSIEVSEAKQRELIKLFEQRQRRAPNESERRQLLQRYVEDEALFREGLRLSLVHTDPVLRGQLVARVRGLLMSEIEPTPPADGELQRYYEEHRSDYAVPETLSYREYWVHRGPDAGSNARRLVQALRADKLPDDDLPAPTEHSALSRAQLTALYDEEVASSLWSLPNGTWHELRSERGIHVVRVDQRTPGSQPSFADVREQVSSAYRKAQAARALQAELTRLTSQWRVSTPEAP